MGSLTTPPCSEGLTWTVHKEPVEASVEQIQKFASLFPKNARPIQKRNRRFVIDAS
jgi:carbonic anhydrase